MTARDVKLSFVIVWFILGVVAFTTVLAPFVLPEETVLRLSPVCEWKAKHNRECLMCGMTRSFLLLSRGRLGDSFSANRAGPLLYMAFALNQLVFVAWLVRRAAAAAANPQLREGDL